MASTDGKTTIPAKQWRAQRNQPSTVDYLDPKQQTLFTPDPDVSLELSAGDMVKLRNLQMIMDSKPHAGKKSANPDPIDVARYFRLARLEEASRVRRDVRLRKRQR